MDERVLVFGARGMLGRAVRWVMIPQFETIPITRNECDIETAEYGKLKQLLIGHTPTVVVNCAGVIPQKLAGIPFDEQLPRYMQANAYFPTVLARVCVELRIPLIHISTDCVYSGNRGGYIETCPHDATDGYGISKSLGEPPSATIIRTSIIGEEGRLPGDQRGLSFLEWVRSHPKGSRVTGYTGDMWNGVTCVQLARIIRQMILTHNYWTGVRHIFSPLAVSKYELIKIISDTYDLALEVTPHWRGKIDKTLASKFLPDYDIPLIPTQIKTEMEYWAQF